MGFGDVFGGVGKGFNSILDPIASFGTRLFNFGDATLTMMQYLPYIIVIGGGLFIIIQLKNTFK